MKKIRLPVFCAFTIGIICSFLLYYLVDQLEHEKIENDFNKVALEIILTVKDSVTNQISCFNYIISFFTASHDIDSEHFKKYLKTLKKQYPNIHSIGWIPYSESQKGFFFSLKEGQIKNLPDTTPSIKDGKIVGLDMKMDLVLNMLLKDAKKQRTISQPIRSGNNTDIFFMTPILGKNGLKGFIVISFDANKMIKDRLSSGKYIGMNFHVTDITNNKLIKKIYSEKPKKINVEKSYIFKKPLNISRSVTVANRIWKLECEASKDYYSQKFSYSTLVILAGLFVTVLISHYLLLLIKQHEVAREESERKLSFIWQNVPDGIIEVDKWGNVLFANNAFSNVVADESIGQSVFKYLEDNEKFVLATALERAVKFGDTQTYETFIERPEKMFYFFNRIIAINHKSKEATFLVISTDITEGKKSEENLKQKEQQLRQIIDSLPHAIFARDKNGYYKLVNKALAREYGMTMEELIGMHYRDIPANKEYYERIMREDKEVISERKNKYILESYINEDGDKRIVETIKIPYALKKDETAVLGISVDITDIKLAEAQLEKTVSELTRSNAELERFAYVASHDLQEPLRTIYAYTQLLEEHNKDVFDEDSKEYIEYITNDVSHLSSLVKALLIYSKMSSVSVRTGGKEAIDCNQIFEYVHSNLKTAMEETNASIKSDSLPVVSANKVHITQLFQNLLSNALKYRRDDVAPEIYLGVKKKGAFWEFYVKDNGIGIDDEYHMKIFEAFKRLHSKHEYEGTGIGLAICKKAVESLGGEIWLESEVGEGATFYFTVPID